MQVNVAGSLQFLTSVTIFFAIALTPVLVVSLATSAEWCTLPLLWIGQVVKTLREEVDKVATTVLDGCFEVCGWL